MHWAIRRPLRNSSALTAGTLFMSSTTHARDREPDFQHDLAQLHPPRLARVGQDGLTQRLGLLHRDGLVGLQLVDHVGDGLDLTSVKNAAAREQQAGHEDVERSHSLLSSSDSMQTTQPLGMLVTLPASVSSANSDDTIVRKSSLSRITQPTVCTVTRCTSFTSSRGIQLCSNPVMSFQVTCTSGKWCSFIGRAPGVSATASDGDGRWRTSRRCLPAPAAVRRSPRAAVAPRATCPRIPRHLP